MVYYTQHYVIDWDKVKTLDDVKMLLKGMSITFEPDFHKLSELGDLVRLEEKSAAGSRKRWLGRFGG